MSRLEVSAGAKPHSQSWKWRFPLWCGMDAFAWIRLLRRNRFAVDPRGLHRCALISVCAVANTVLRYTQELLWATRVNETDIVDAPLFVIGHWRSGTSLLHELLALDPRHAVPTTYECFFPNHFLLTEPHLPRLLQFLMPSHRPMDNMAMSWDGPLEDEFALCNLGLPSPYLTIAFPNEPPPRDDLDMDRLPREAVVRWQQALLRFLRQITVRAAKRIVLKSPPHSFRIKELLELFPDARFVHIVRNPFNVFPSTLNLWRRLYEVQGLQKPTFEGLENYVFDTYLQLFEQLHQGRALVSPSRFCELRYEDLVKEPIGQLRAVYQHLDLGDFQSMVPRVEKYLKDTEDYRTNRYELTPETRERIAQRWGQVARRYGYMEEHADRCIDVDRSYVSGPSVTDGQAALADTGEQ
jgi:hypothetical protein